jgi:hypothetical protein
VLSPAVAATTLISLRTRPLPSAKKPRRGRRSRPTADIAVDSSVQRRGSRTAAVGTSVKIKRSRLEAAPGLRIAIVPDQAGHSDAIYRDEAKNLVVCPIPHDQSFMEVFYEGWRLVQSLCASDFKMPPPAAVPSPLLREVAGTGRGARASRRQESAQRTRHGKRRL